MVDAGAGSPEELRALAERLRVQRDLEASAWRSEVKPALIRSKKRRVHLGDPVEPSPSAERRASLVLAGVVGIVVLVLLLLATRTGVVLLLVPVAGVLVYAWVQGRQASGSGDGGPPPPPDPID